MRAQRDRAHWGLVVTLFGVAGCQQVAPERFNRFPVSKMLTGEDYCHRAAPVECEYAARCNPALHAAWEAHGGCAAGARAHCLAVHARDLGPFSTGRVRFVPGTGESCLALLALRQCGDAEPSACHEMFKGLLQERDLCTGPGDCAGPFYCAQDALGCGLCLAKGAAPIPKHVLEAVFVDRSLKGPAFPFACRILHQTLASWPRARHPRTA